MEEFQSLTSCLDFKVFLVTPRNQGEGLRSPRRGLWVLSAEAMAQGRRYQGGHIEASTKQGSRGLWLKG